MENNTIINISNNLDNYCWNTSICSSQADKTCGKCHIAKYCSVKCQREHWSQHKLSCSKLKNNINTNKKTDFDLVGFMDTFPIISSMMGKNQIYGILYYLKQVIDNGIEGDIVELGCNVGTTSIFIRKFLDVYGCDKKYHVYDGWQGLPPKVKEDESATSYQFPQGCCKTTKDYFISVFNHFNLELPIIHSGWFKEIPDNEYPEKICLAFYDGDFYTSITDSFNKTFDKVQKGGIIIIDDIGGDSLDNHPLPGSERAVIDFLKSRRETYDYSGYANKDFVFDNLPHGGAKINKL
uniref:MYND-type domain-containing protein n=1 Tax=viral metagenome TaxID=1070528 RepID=A0A6C0EUN7_9ZZZZ